MKTTTIAFVSVVFSLAAEGGVSVGPGLHSDFSVPGVGQGVISGVSGVTWGDFSGTDCYGRKTFVNSAIPDAEKTAKTTDDDESWCYPLSDMDALFFTGWAGKTGFNTVDDMKESFTAKTLRGFSDFNVSEGTYGFRKNRTWGDLLDWYKDKTGIDLVGQKNVTEREIDSSLLSSLGKHLDNGAGVVRVNVLFDPAQYNKTWKGKGTLHGSLCVGYVANAGTLKALFIVDPDNDQHTGSGGRSAPNSIIYCPVSWNSAWQEWTIEGIWGQDGVVSGNYRAFATMPGGGSSGGSSGGGGSGQSTASAKYKVAFLANGGKGKMSAQSMTRGKSAVLRKNAFTRNGYVFIGWAKTKTGAVAYGNKAAVKDLAAAGKTATLYAKWAKKNYKIQFVANGGKLPKGKKMPALKMTYGKAKKLTANKFTRKGYVFKGWAKSKALAKKGKVAYKNKKSVKNLVTSGKTVKLYAVWKKKNPSSGGDSPVNMSYSVFFDANGGAGTMYAQDFDHDESKALQANAYERPGFVFAGWAKTEGGAVAYSDRQTVRNLSTGAAVWLYAVWRSDPSNPAQTLSFGGLSFVTAKSAPWRETTVDGTKALVSAPIGDNGKSTLYLMVTGPGTLSFKTRVICEVPKDQLKFRHPSGSWSQSGQSGVWSPESIAIPSGTHVLTWTYEKDASGSYGSDCGWLSDVKWTK